MSSYQIILTSAEDKALSYAAVSPDEWIQNVVHSRCGVAIDEIVSIAVQKCLDAGIQIPGTKDEIVELAFDNSWVKTATQRQAEYEAAVEAEQAARQTQE